MANAYNKGPGAKRGILFSVVDGLSVLDWLSQEVLIRSIDNSRACLTSKVPTDATNQSVAMQAEIDVLWVMTGGKGGTYILKDGFTYVAEGLIHRPGITIRSENILGTFTEGSSEWSGARIRPPVFATKPVISNDKDNGFIRATPTLAPNQYQRFAKIAILGVMIGGYQNLTQSTANVDLIRLESCWGVTLRNVQLTNSRAFGIRAIDCNALDIDSCFGCNAPWYFDSLADSSIRNSQNGGGNGFCSTVVWFTNVSWKNQFLNNFIYNNNNNGLVTTNPRKYAFRMKLGTVTPGTDSIQFDRNNVNTDANHYWQDGVPVVVLTDTGTLPGGITKMKTYYVKVINATTVKLSSSLYNLKNSIYVDITSAHTGEVWVTVGPEANLALTDGCEMNAISGRYDQGHGPGVLLDRSPNNVFDWLTVQENSFGNYMSATLGGDLACVAPIPGPGVVLQNGSYGNVFGAGILNGHKQGALNSTVEYESRQKHGISVDASSSVKGTRLGGLSVVNHTEANSVAGASNFADPILNPDRFLLNAVKQFELVAGTPSVGLLGTPNKKPVWLLDKDVSEAIASEVLLPLGFASISVRVGFVNATALSGSVVLGLSLDWYSPGSSLDQVSSLIAVDAVKVTGAQNVVTEVIFSNLDVALATGLPLFLTLRRAADSGSDTLAGDIGILYVIVE